MAVVKLAPKLLALSIVAIGFLSCFSFENSEEWIIKPVPIPSQGAAFYVLHNWQDTYSHDAGEVKALGLSDIMLKTMGILKDGVSWPGVQMTNLFSRPQATALFVVDRVPKTAEFGSLSQHSYPVDQTGLCACPMCEGEDLNRMFGAEGVATHLSRLFDGKSRTLSVSANNRAAIGASAQGSYTTKREVDTLIADMQSSDVLAGFGLEEAGRLLDLQDEVDLRLLAEVVLVRQAVASLQDGPTGYVTDGAPDVFIFTFSTLRAVELKYGEGSEQLKLAVQLVKDCIATATKDLVAIYNGRVLVQGVVLEWEYPEQTAETDVLVGAYELLAPYLGGSTLHSFVNSLPHVHLDGSMVGDREALCRSLEDALKPSYTAVCPEAVKPYDSRFANDRVLRDIGQDDMDSSNFTTNVLGGISEERTENFAAIFLITLFLTVSLGLALFAVGWAMWTMDPGRDSIIYRQVSDPTT